MLHESSTKKALLSLSRIMLILTENLRASNQPDVVVSVGPLRPTEAVSSEAYPATHLWVLEGSWNC